jgi:hypothetical protein
MRFWLFLVGNVADGDECMKFRANIDVMMQRLGDIDI